MARFITTLMTALLLAAPADASRLQVPQITTSDDAILAEARRYFNLLDYERAAAALDRVIDGLERRLADDSTARQALVAAYEMRGRSRFGLGDPRGAADDFRALLKLAPEFRLSADVSPRVVAVFEETRKLAVGQVMLVVDPDDAVLMLDGVPWRPTGAAVHLGIGGHVLSATHAGYRPLTLPFEVAPGITQDLAVTMERLSASLTLLISPPGVEVIVNGVVRGRTEPATGNEASHLAAKVGVAPALVSKPFVVDDVAPGVHSLELRRECHTPFERRVAVEKLLDYQLEPIRLKPTVATLQITSSAADVTVFVDDVPRGTVPLVLPNVCEGAHVVELRTPSGRAVRRLAVRTGDDVLVEMTPKPAFAILSVAAVPTASSGTQDLRVSVERALAGASTVTIFAPAAERAERLLKAHGLGAGWLTPSLRQSGGDAAVTPPALQEVSRSLAKSLDVQGLAAVTVVPGVDRSELLISLLAAGSGEPDVVRLRPDSSESAARVQAQLDAPIALTRASLGLVALDVLDVSGAVVGRVDGGGPAATAGLVAGDVIISADAQPIRDVAALDAILQKVKRDARVVLEIRAVGGDAKKLEITPASQPRALALTDRSILFNKVLIDLRNRLVGASSTPEEAAVRLNIAIALIRLGNWAEANDELGRVTLPDGPGVSRGTVQYLQGLCFEAIGMFADAEKAWREAAGRKEAVLDEDGPTVAELAQAKLEQLRRARGTDKDR